MEPIGLPHAGTFTKQETPGPSPAFIASDFRWETSSGGEDSVDPSACFSESGLYRWEIADTHDLEDQLVDLSFHTQENVGPVALPATWLPGRLHVDHTRLLLRRSSSFLSRCGCLGLLGVPTKVPRQTQRCSHLVHYGLADRPVESGSLPRLVHGIDVSLGMVVQELLDEHCLAWTAGCF